MNDLTMPERFPTLRCTASRPRSGVWVAHVAGELDMASAPFVGQWLRDLTVPQPADLVLDLSDVTLLAAAGLTLLMSAMHNEGGIHGRLHLVGVTGNRPVEQALRLTGLTSVLDIHDDLQTLLDVLPRR